MCWRRVSNRCVCCVRNLRRRTCRRVWRRRAMPLGSGYMITKPTMSGVVIMGRFFFSAKTAASCALPIGATTHGATNFHCSTKTIARLRGSPSSWTCAALPSIPCSRAERLRVMAPGSCCRPKWCCSIPTAMCSRSRADHRALGRRAGHRSGVVAARRSGR